MAGLFDALGTAARGLQTVQRGLSTTGHNIANVDTPGYSRQRAVLQTGLPQPDPRGTIGTGVEQVTVERIVDQFVGSRLISETSRKASLETESASYQQVEAVVNDQLVDGLRADLDALFKSLDDLANSIQPGQPDARAQVVVAAQTVVDTFHRYDSQLRGLATSMDRAITGSVPEINQLSREIADLNREIAQASTTSTPNDLLDRRDQLILELSEKVEIQTLSGEGGVVSVRLPGGIPLVDNGIASELVAGVVPADPNPFDPTFSKIYYGGVGSGYEVTSLIRGGELGGLIESRDSIIAGTIRDLDALAFTLSETLNTQHRAGFGLADDQPHDFFADLSGQPTVDDSARNIALAADIDFDQGGTADNIAAGAALDPLGVGPGAAAGDVGAMRALIDLGADAIPSYLPGDVPGTPTGSSVSISGALGALISDIGLNASASSRALEQQESVLSSVQARRDSISGVSIDEEVADLVKLQASFQANARVISTVQTLLDSLFNAL